MTGYGGVLILSAVIATIILMVITRNKDEKGWTTYIIKKGKHFSSRTLIGWLWKVGFVPKVLRFSAIFADGCDYDDNKLGARDREDINKLYGVSYGFDTHYRSVRIGWRYNTNLKVIELFIYSYVKGRRFIKKILNCRLYDQIDFIIFKQEDSNVAVVKIKANGTEVEELVHGIDTDWIRFKEFPFFGGDKKAPNDMKIFIK